MNIRSNNAIPDDRRPPVAGAMEHGLRRDYFRRLSLVLLAWPLAVVGAALLEAQSPASPDVFRVGVSYASFGTLSRNDAGAALKVWAAAVVKERALPLEVRIEMFERESELREALARQRVDAATMTAEEFVQSGQKPEFLFLTARDKSFTEQFVILVRRGSGIEDLPALKGRKLILHSSPKTGLAQPWLETLLASRSLAPAKELLGELTTIENPSKAVLRVFFRQSDACVVTANAFELACELNPQLRKELKVLASSPPLIPSFLFFRPGYTSPSHAELEAAILDLHATTSGQQVLTVFQGSRMEKRPVSCLDTTRQLLGEYQRLLSSRSQGGRPSSGSGSVQ